MKHIFTFEPHARVVGMTSYRGKLLVATTDGLYEWDGEREEMHHLNFNVYLNANDQEIITAWHCARPWGY